MLRSINPTTGQVIAQYDYFTELEVEDYLDRAGSSFYAWRNAKLDHRAFVLERISDVLLERKSELARLATFEMGKPLKAAEAEIEKCALVCRYYAAFAPRFLADEKIETEAETYIRRLPLGVILAIMPWNFPFWQVFRCIAPALIAGNVVLLKHAANVTQCALAIADVLKAARLPEGVFQVLLISNDQVQQVIDHPGVKAVTLTGSERAGMAVASQAGLNLKKCVLELGGSDPFIVMPSADLKKAVEVGVQARMMNAGQSCVCAKRFILHERIYAEFEREFVQRVEALKVGDPLLETTDMGPLVSADALTNLSRQVQRAIEAGGRLLTGGKPIEGPGAFFKPGVLTDVPLDAEISNEEFFGPVAMFFRVQNLDQAVAIANATPFGLGSSVWTNDSDEQTRFINEIEAGQTFVNAMVSSDPRLPFGGVKRSGYGRELGPWGLQEFTNPKTVFIAPA
jgi:succinate-semialdehyde dehydrogenase/glutarate-semialdehyde dehydrogenase